MFSRKRRQVPVGAFFVALTLLLVSRSAFPDSWNNKRYNGQACNGYWLDRSVITNGYQTTVTQALNAWKKSSFVTPGLFSRSYTSPSTGLDKIYISGSTPDKNEGAFTAVFIKTSSGRIRERTNDSENDLPWQYCKIYVYLDRIQNRCAPFGAGFVQNVVKHTVLHEIGHSLKLAHPNCNAGTFGVNVPLGPDDYSVMEKDFKRGLVTDVQPYDESELQRKWGP